MKFYARLSKPLALVLALLLLSPAIFAATIKLKITYNGAGVANNDITVKLGDVPIGTGRTNQDGDVSISTSASFPPNIDVYGYVKTNNGEKNWDLKGWVVLDDNHFAHIKMEDVLKEFEGMGMPSGMMAEAWGLAFSTGGGGNVAAQPNQPGEPVEQERPKKNAQPVAEEKPAAPAIPTGYRCMPMSAGDFANTKTSIDQEDFDSDKMRAAENAIRGNCMEAAQVKELMSLLTMSGDRLDLAKFAYDHVANPNAYNSVEDALKMETDKRELREFIASRQGNAGKTETKPAAGNAPSLPPTIVHGANYTLTVIAEEGERFILYVDDLQHNASPQSKVVAPWVYQEGKLPKMRIEFEDKNIPTLEKKVIIGGYANESTYTLKRNNKGEYVLRIKAS